MSQAHESWLTSTSGRVAESIDNSQAAAGHSTAAAGDHAPSTRQAMQDELKTIESLTIRIVAALAVVILVYAGAIWWIDRPDMLQAEKQSRIEASLSDEVPTPDNKGASSVPLASTKGSATTPLATPSGAGTDAGNREKAAEQETKAAPAGPLIPPGFLSTASLYSALLICAVVSGGLLGFLFGIPRQSLKPTPAGVAAAAASEPDRGSGSFAGNTNLEEISDWLTKIIVGLGLTQAGALYGAFVNAKDAFVAHSMAYAPGSDSMFTAIFLSGLILGFLSLYMETRTRVALLLVTSDHVQNSYGGEKLLKVLTRRIDPERALNTVRITSVRSPSQRTSPSEDDFKIAALPIEAPRDTNELITWVMAQVNTRNFEQAEKALRRAVTDLPDRAEFYTSLAAVRNWAGKPKAANEILDQAAQRFPDNTRVWKDKLLASLYLPAPDSYRGALAAADALKARDPTASNDPFVWFWIACAYGQKVSFLPEGEEKMAARASALEAVRAVIANSQPGSLVRLQLRKVYDPAIENSDPLENDLEVFHGDPDFVEEVAKAI